MRQVLVLNSGSSSIKFRLYASEGRQLDLLQFGQIEGIGSQPAFGHGNGKPESLPEGADHKAALDYLLTWLQPHLDDSVPLLVGHRVVHGGADFTAPVAVGPPELARLQELIPLAPLHQPHNLAAIEALMALQPDLFQVACFDTAFHSGHRDIIDRFALPRRYHDAGVRRYGFHGLSYEYIAAELQRVEPALASGNWVIAHLGNGASLCALQQGRSIDSTMGFSALEGLMMGTRTGSIDAGVLLYMLQEEGLHADQIANILYRESGLLGVSGISNDMRELLQSDSQEAEQAIELYVHRIIREASALCGVLGGIDGIVFTAGIGEHAAAIRARVCNGLEWLGVSLDSGLNTAGETVISSTDSRVRVRVMATNEELMIARHTLNVAEQVSEH